MATIPTYDKVNDVFEKAVIAFQNNLQYLANEGKVSQKFITKQNGILKALINYQQQTERIISQLEMDNTELANRKLKGHDILKDTIWCLEAICIIHGILDFPAWVVQGKKSLIHEAKETYQDGSFFLPCKLKERFDELPKEEKEQLDKVLYKKHYEEIERVENLIAELKAKQQNELRIQRD